MEKEEISAVRIFLFVSDFSVVFFFFLKHFSYYFYRDSDMETAWLSLLQCLIPSARAARLVAVPQLPAREAG